MKRVVLRIFNPARRIWLRQIGITALSAGVAWLVGDALIPHGGVVAAIVSTLSIRISLYKSVREGFGQIVGTGIGAAIALLCVKLFTFGFLAVAITVLLCAVLSRSLHLGEVASVNVPVTALIVIGPGLSGSTATHRFLSTLVGAGVAIGFSYFAHSKTPAGRTVDQIQNLGRKAAALLIQMSEGLITGVAKDKSGAWLAEARVLIEEVPALRSQAIEAKKYARWSPLAELETAEELYLREIAIEHTVIQVRAIARTIFDSQLEGGFPFEANRSLAIALSAASEAITSKIALIYEDRILEQVPEVDATSEDLRAAASALTAQLISHAQEIDEAVLVRAMSIVSNMSVIADSLDQSSPALTAVDTPGEPAHLQVLSMDPEEQILQLRTRIVRSVRRFLKATFTLNR